MPKIMLCAVSGVSVEIRDTLEPTSADVQENCGTLVKQLRRRFLRSLYEWTLRRL